jgi:hypothetical protein
LFGEDQARGGARHTGSSGQSLACNAALRAIP